LSGGIQDLARHDPAEYQLVVAGPHASSELAVEEGKRVLEDGRATPARAPTDPRQLVLVPARPGAEAAGQLELPLLQDVEREAAPLLQRLVGGVVRIDAQGQEQGIERHLRHPGGGEHITSPAAGGADGIYAKGEGAE
jgi:hypothetical protein